jgi:hypothetical protein
MCAAKSILKTQFSKQPIRFKRATLRKVPLQHRANDHALTAGFLNYGDPLEREIERIEIIGKCRPRNHAVREMLTEGCSGRQQDHSSGRQYSEVHCPFRRRAVRMRSAQRAEDAQIYREAA